MLENKELFDTVEDVKSDFNDYFARIGGKSLSSSTMIGILRP